MSTSARDLDALRQQTEADLDPAWVAAHGDEAWKAALAVAGVTRSTPDPTRTRTPSERSSADMVKLVKRVVRLRQSLGTRLLADAENAYTHALRQVGIKVQTRARRQSRSRQAHVAEVVRAHGPLAPILAVIGIDEAELFKALFDALHVSTLQQLQQNQDQIRQAIQQYGVARAQDLLLEFGGKQGQGLTESAADYLARALQAIVRQRAMAGDKEIARQLAPRMVPGPLAIPRARGPVPGGFDMEGLPNPEDLAQSAARFVRNAMSIADGKMHMRLPESPDHVPEVTELDTPGLLDQLAAMITVSPVWEWQHGFYGEPVTVFRPHDDLDGFRTTDRDNDPGLANDVGWPDVPFFAPADHDGCTCEWVPVEPD